MRLIDVDALREQMKDFYEKRAEEANMTGNRVVCVTWHDAVMLIESAPIITETRLSEDDKEVIRIHLGAVKEDLCNQHRWDEAREYEGIIERLNDLPSAQPEIVRCKDCKYHDDEEPGAVYCPDWVGGWVSEDFFCAGGERRGNDD